MPSEPSDGVIKDLIAAITKLDYKVTQLTLRLTGDADLQTTGLIHDVADGRNKISDLIGKGDGHGRRLDAIERQNAEQAGMLDDLRLVRAVTNKLWKVIGILIMGGVLHPIVVAFVTKILSGGK